MLRALGLASVDELFADIPAGVRVDGLSLPPGLPEADVVERITDILAKNRVGRDLPTFLGAGLYNHFVPASVRAIASRSEFATSYTPYQPELSQGILQALFEYQSMICELTGMDAANTSMYDGSTALGEAALMAARITGKREIVLPRALHWERRQVLENYGRGPGLRYRDVPYDREDGTIDLAALKEAVGPDIAAMYVETPNFFGRFERIEEIREIAFDRMVGPEDRARHDSVSGAGVHDRFEAPWLAFHPRMQRHRHPELAHRRHWSRRPGDRQRPGCDTGVPIKDYFSGSGFSMRAIPSNARPYPSRSCMCRLMYSVNTTRL